MIAVVGKRIAAQEAPITFIPINARFWGNELICLCLMKSMSPFT
jgi:hypothetical protein